MASCGAATAAAAPTVTINQAATQADPTNASPIRFTVVFSEPVSGFTASDVSLAGSTVGGTLMRSLTGGGPSFTVTVTGMSGQGTLVASIPAGVANSESGPNEASTSTDNTVSFDNVRPSVTVNQAAAQPDPTNASPILFTVTFSEPVTGFTTSDVSLAGSTAGGRLEHVVTGSGANYTVSVTGMESGGLVVASVAAGAAVDATGNTSFASTSTDNSVTLDDVRPGVTIDQALAQADPTHSKPVLFSVAFSEAVTGFTSSDVSLAGSTLPVALTVSVTGSGASYTVSVAFPISASTGSGTIVVGIPANAASDLAGNLSFVSTSSDDTVAVVEGNERAVDFNADRRTDHVAYHPATAQWFIRSSFDASVFTMAFGASGYTPLLGDFDGDDRTDMASFHPPTGLWFIRSTATGVVTSSGFGGSGYEPVRGDFDGDGKTDLAVFHDATGLWFIKNSSDGTVTTIGYGASGYVPVPGDYDGDGKTNLAMYHPPTGLWFVRSAAGTTTTTGFGGAAYTPVRGDFDGDGRTDVAVYHETSGLWFVRNSSTGAITTTGFGAAGYAPVPEDYDADGKTDLAVYHQPSGLWFVKSSATGATSTVGFGGLAYVPLN